VVAHRKQVPATADEWAYMARVKDLPCWHCNSGIVIMSPQQTPTQVHHIVRGKRLGHFYTLALCEDCHKVVHRFKNLERTYWELQNEKLGITREWATSKTVPRRAV
jgi:RecA-dependent nuclease